MARKKNQHYLPQYYFRFFSQDGKRINLLHVRDGKLVPTTGIRRQCSKSYFYGDEGAEDVITSLEDVYRPALSLLKRERRLVGHWHTLLGALLFQKTRSHLERERPREAVGKLLRVFLEVQANKLDDPKKRALLLNNLDSVEPNPRQFHSMMMVKALQGAPQVSDLHAVLIENLTGRPFIFSDAPVVFFNEASAHITYMGSYGVACSGLQIICPIDPTLLLFVYDPGQYELDRVVDTKVEVSEEADVDSLNRLQLHNCLAAVYFHCWEDREYVRSLWVDEEPELKMPESKVQTGPLTRPGVEEQSEVMHIYDPPLNTRLDLSFVRTTPVEDTGRANLRDASRSIRLAEESEASLDYLEGLGPA